MATGNVAFQRTVPPALAEEGNFGRDRGERHVGAGLRLQLRHRPGGAGGRRHAVVEQSAVEGSSPPEFLHRWVRVEEEVAAGRRSRGNHRVRHLEEPGVRPRERDYPDRLSCPRVDLLCEQPGGGAILEDAIVEIQCLLDSAGSDVMPGEPEAEERPGIPAAVGVAAVTPDPA